MNPEFLRQHQLFLAQARAQHAAQQQQHQEEAYAQQQQHAAFASAQYQAELDLLTQLREEEERSKLMSSLMEQQHQMQMQEEEYHRQQQQQQQNYQLLLQQEHQQRLLRERRAAAVAMGGYPSSNTASGGASDAAAAYLTAAANHHPHSAPSSSSIHNLDLANNTLRAEAVEQILALQEAQRHQRLINYNELEQLQELEQLRQLELMMQYQDQQQQLQQQQNLSQHYLQQQGGGGMNADVIATKLPNNPPPNLHLSNNNVMSTTSTTTDITPSNHQYVASQTLRAQLQRRILEEEILETRSALQQHNNNSSSSNGNSNNGEGSGDNMTGGGGGSERGSSKDVHRLQNILLQQELQAHQLPTYLSFGDSTSTPAAGVNDSDDGGIVLTSGDFSLLRNNDGINVLPRSLLYPEKNVSSVSSSLPLMPSSSSAQFVSSGNNSISNNNNASSQDETIISKFLTVVMTRVPEVTPSLMELIPDVMAGLIPSSSAAAAAATTTEEQKEQSNSNNSIESASKFPTVVEVTMNKLKTLQQNACLMEAEDLYARVTNCIVAIEPYTSKFGSGGVGGSDVGGMMMYHQAQDMLMRGRNNTGYGSLLAMNEKMMMEDEELPLTTMGLGKSSSKQDKGEKRAASKQRKKKLPKKKKKRELPSEDSMSVMEMYRLEKRMKRKLARREAREAGKVPPQQQEEKEVVEDDGVEEKKAEAVLPPTPVIRHNLLSSPYKIAKEEEEKDAQMELGEGMKDGQKEEKDATAVDAKEVSSEKAEKVSLSDEEPNEVAERASLSRSGASSVESNVPFTGNDNEKKGNDDKVDASTPAFPLTSPQKASPQKSVERTHEMDRNEDKSIRLQDGTLLFQPTSSPPAFLRKDASPQVSKATSPSHRPAVAENTTKDDISHDNDKSKSPSNDDTGTTNDGADFKNGSKESLDEAHELHNADVSLSNDARNQSENADTGGANEGKDDEDNDDNRADVANVLLGLMGR